jgi:glutamate-1-semialdehyde 2,1-aminomutase
MTKDLARYPTSIQFLSESKRYLANGVSSGMRAAAKPLPLYFASGSGSHLLDVDGNNYIDYTLAWGPLILGHSHPAITAAVGAQLKLGQTFGAQHELEVLVAKKLCGIVPCADRVIFSNTGTEAVQIAFRLARASTGRSKILRFEGHYHGWLDDVLLGYRPDPSGTKAALPSDRKGRDLQNEIVVAGWNDLPRLETILQQQADEIAAIMTEPILCNCGCLLPSSGYLQGLRDLATRYGVVLIFDEVITGLRVPGGSAQAFYGVTPDLATFGKAVAGGFPLSVVAGNAEMMSLIEQGKVPHAGTFNGNPISLAAAHATLSVLETDQWAPFKAIDRIGNSLIEGIKQSAAVAGIPVLVNGIGASFSLAFTTRREMSNYWHTLDADVSARDLFIEAMLSAGIYLLPDGRWYVSLAHTEADVRQTLDCVNRVFAAHKSRLVPTLTP